MNDQVDGPAEAADLIEAIGQRLWSVMPEGARELHFVAVIHDDCEPGWEPGGVLDWVKEDGSRGFYSDPSQRPPYALEREVIALLRRLRGLAPFRREPWTHVQVALAADGRVRADFAYVDRDDEWANLYMRGVSELTLEEARQNFIPASDWAEKLRRAMVRLENKAAALEATSLFEDAARVRAQLDAIRPRLATYERI